jgi:hypothetical protein
MQRRFFVSCEFADASAMAVLMEGCKAHADVDSHPLWSEECKLLLGDFVEGFPARGEPLEETWMAIFPNDASLMTFAELLATIEFKLPDYVRFVDVDSNPGVTLIFNMKQFHRFVFHEI